MQMFYVTRYEHNSDRETEYYIGGGRFAKINHDRISPRLYNKEAYVKLIVEKFNECDWHYVDFRE